MKFGRKKQSGKPSFDHKKASGRRRSLIAEYEFKTSGDSPDFWLTIHLVGIPDKMVVQGLFKVAKNKVIGDEWSERFKGTTGFDVPNQMFGNINKIMRKDKAEILESLSSKHDLTFVSSELQRAFYHRSDVGGGLVLTACFKGEYSCEEEE